MDFQVSHKSFHRQKVIHNIGLGALVFVDFSKNVQVQFLLKIPIKKIWPFKDRWIMETSNTGTAPKFLLALAKDGINWRLEMNSIDVAYSYKKSPLDLSDIGPKWLAAYTPPLHGAVVNELPGEMSIEGWPREISDPCQHNYINFQTVHSYLDNSKQFASIIPSTKVIPWF
jgi:hypothetical protein